MNITAYVLHPEFVVSQRDVVVYQDPFGMIGKVVKAGTEMIALRGANSISVIINGLAGYILG